MKTTLETALANFGLTTEDLHLRLEGSETSRLPQRRYHR